MLDPPIGRNRWRASMNFDLHSALPFLIPKAIAWAENRAAEIASLGSPLDEAGISIAQQVGVAQPKLILILVVGQLPTPSDPQLLQAAAATGLLGPDTIGLALGHGVYIRQGHSSIRVLSHECRHVHQCEQAGSI